MVFNIGEPVMQWSANVLNPIMFIPYVLTPMVMVTVAYLATFSGLGCACYSNVTWVMLPIYGFFATAFDWRAILSLVIAISIAIYLPLSRWQINRGAINGKI